MARLLIGFILAVFFSGAALAQTPPEVLKPYKEYRAALEAGDDQKAYKKAKEAWETAEDILGDHKTTGDLAANFAAFTPAIMNDKIYEDLIKVHDRAIELASLHDDNAIEVELERHLGRIQAGLSRQEVRGRKVKRGGDMKFISDMEEALQSFGEENSVFAADLDVLRLQYYLLKGQSENAVLSGEYAQTRYANLSETANSKYAYNLPLYRAKAYEQNGDIIKSALQYQEILTDTKTYREDNILTQRANSSWLRLRYDIEDKGLLEAAKSAGLCDDCGTVSISSPSPTPVIRMPPMMPAKIVRSGEVSALFDLDDAGFVQNIRIVSSSEDIFHKAVKKAMKSWRYSKASPESNIDERKNIAVRIIFTLRDGRGKIIKGRSIKTHIPTDEPLKISPDNIIQTTGMRMRRN